MQDVVWHQTKITTQLHCMGCDIGGVQLLYWSFHANVASILANHKIPSSRISFRWHANHEWSIKLGRDKKNCCPSNPFRWHCQDNCYDWSINLSVGNVFCRSVCGNVSSMWIAIRFIGSVFFLLHVFVNGARLISNRSNCVTDIQVHTDSVLLRDRQ